MSYENDDKNPRKNESTDRPEGDENPRPGDDRPNPVFEPGRFFRNGLGWVIVLGVLLVATILFSNGANRNQQIGLHQFFNQLKNDELLSVVLGDSGITVTRKTPTGQPGARGTQFDVNLPPEYIAPLVERITDECVKHGAKLDYVQTHNYFMQMFLSPLILYLLVFGFIWFVIFRQIRNSGGGAGMLGNFGRSRHRVLTRERTSVTFDDVAGIQEAKEDVQEIVEFLRKPSRFQRLGGRIPRGVLLIGDPGCGKTLLAKAIAGEAGVPFFSISGSDFVEMFVGVGASRVRDLFAQAKTNAPCIIFLDEIDAVGRKRGVGFNGGGHDEREQTLNAILVEMDGFDSSDQVIVIAATNRADVLDPALTRPGRFDRQVFVPLPDIKGRFEILKVHAKKVKLAAEVDFWRLARGTPMFSGADLEALINEAAISATMASKDAVDINDLEEARDRVRWGRAKKSRVITESDKRVVAYHEAGHALATELTPNADPLHKVSIIPRGDAGGMTMMLPEGDRMVYTRGYALATLRVMLGGRVAEDIACDDISSGASNDIQRVTQLARTMVCEWGMSDRIGPMRLGPDRSSQWMSELQGQEYSAGTAELIDSEVKTLIREAYDDIKAKLSSKRSELDQLAEALLKYETLDVQDVKRILNGEVIDKPTVTDLLAAAGKSDASVSMSRPVKTERVDSDSLSSQDDRSSESPSDSSR